MSLVVYNDNFEDFKVVLHDPSSSTMIVHDPQSNKLQMIKISHDNLNSEQQQPQQLCPHCGQPFNGFDEHSFNQRPFNNPKYVNNQYFKLLALTNNEEEKTYESIPSNLFTPNYFEKFFKIKKLLGRGSNSTVYQVEHFLNNFSLGHYAVKKIPIGEDIKNLQKTLKEVEMLCLISNQNKNLVQYNHIWLELSQATDFGPVIPCAFILTEYCNGGNLEEFIKNLNSNNLINQKEKIRKIRKLKRQGKSYNIDNKNKRLNYYEILKIFKDIVNGVNELHSHKIIHRDLKPSNCLLKTDNMSLPRILISDFGESQIEGNLRSSTGATGTLEFIAPELINLKENNNFNKYTDMFSLGLILFFICFHELPYVFYKNDNNYNLLKNQILLFNIDEFLRSKIFKDSSLFRNDLGQIEEMLRNLLNKNQKQRMLTDDLLIWINSLISDYERDIKGVISENNINNEKSLDLQSESLEKGNGMIERGNYHEKSLRNEFNDKNNELDKIERTKLNEKNNEFNEKITNLQGNMFENKEHIGNIAMMEKNNEFIDKNNELNIKKPDNKDNEKMKKTLLILLNSIIIYTSITHYYPNILLSNYKFLILNLFCLMFTIFNYNNLRKNLLIIGLLTLLNLFTCYFF